MKTNELIKALNHMKVQTGSLMCLGCGYEHSCGLHGCAIIREAADRLEHLNHFDNTQSYKMLKKLRYAQEDMRKVANSGGDMCLVCKNMHECPGESCPGYTFDVLDQNGTLPDGRSLAGMKITCESFDWGTCDIMKNTPCNGCIDGGFKNFEWRDAPSSDVAEVRHGRRKRQ